MGAGKTRVGSAVAARLGRNHADLDIMVANRVGRSVGVIFAEGGEEAFRDLEQEALADTLSGDKPLVVSTGGGVVERPERPANRQLLAERALVVWLRAEPGTLAARVADGSGRPLLADGDPVDLLVALAERRHPLYHTVSDQVVDTDRLDVDAVAALVEQVAGDGAGVAP
jgi:shikimate kinase